MSPPLTLLKGATVWAPKPLGITDVLVAGEVIVQVAPSLDVRLPPGLLDTHDLSGLTLTPGLIDAHVHILGGGGGDGYDSRIPELALSDLTSQAITTVVGAPGIDMVSRSIEGLLAKAYALNSEGISAFIYVGGFHQPGAFLTGSVTRDIYAVPNVVGIKIAVGEGRATRYSRAALIDLASELAWVERASSRCAVLHVHLGNDLAGLELLESAIAGFPRPERVVVTHCNMSEEHLRRALALVPQGVYADMTSKFSPARGMTTSIPASDAVFAARDSGVNMNRVSVSTDGNGSVPAVNDGRPEPYHTYVDTLLDAIRDLHQRHGLALDDALRVATEVPAAALRLEGRKGRIAPGLDADLIGFGPGLRIQEVYARGRRMVHHGTPVAFGRFENRAWVPQA